MDFFFNETNDLIPFNDYSFNGCFYRFENIYKNNKNEYFKIIKNKKTKIKPQKLNNITYLSLKDVNNNPIKVII